MTATDFVEVNGLRLRYSIQGRGRPLLLLNGVGAALELLDPFREQLSDIETIAIDVPGAGESDTPILPIRFCGFARVIASALDTLGYRQVDVLGLSWGGLLAQEFTRRHGDHVRKLVLAATALGCLSVPGRPSALWVLATPQRYYSPSYFERVAPTLYGGAVQQNPELIREHARQRFMHPPTLRGYLWQVAAVYGWSSLAWLRCLTNPTLVIAADDDPIARLINARVLTRCIPNARLHVVPNGGHLFLLTHAREVAPVIENFLLE